MGWKVMPVEATQEMLDAPLADNGDVTLGDLVVSGKVYESRRDLRPLIWRTLAAAAPPPPNEMTRQGVFNAMKECCDIAMSAQLGIADAGRLTADHFVNMLARAGDPDFSEGKMNRWLGWMQGVLEDRGIITGEQAGEMSRRHKDDC